MEVSVCVFFCQPIEPLIGEELCRLFRVDHRIDLRAIALKSREAMDRRGLDPHELYKLTEIKRFVLPDCQIVRYGGCDLVVVTNYFSCNFAYFS